MREVPEHAAALHRHEERSGHAPRRRDVALVGRELVRAQEERAHPGLHHRVQVWLVMWLVVLDLIDVRHHEAVHAVERDVLTRVEQEAHPLEEAVARARVTGDEEGVELGQRQVTRVDRMLLLRLVHVDRRLEPVGGLLHALRGEEVVVAERRAVMFDAPVEDQRIGARDLALAHDAHDPRRDVGRDPPCGRPREAHLPVIARSL